MNEPAPSLPLIIGWREWLALPELGIPAIKAKIDTGARTSALHAFELETFRENGRNKVRFLMHPLQRRTDIVKECIADILDQRPVRDSGGHLEERMVIESAIRLGGREWVAEFTLTNRDTMKFRMLLGRTAMSGGFLVDPVKSYLTGQQIKRSYVGRLKQ